MLLGRSVFVSLLIGEADSAGFADAIEVAPQRYTSGLVRLETVTATRLDTESGIVSAAFDSLLADTLTTVVPITDAIARLATEAFARYGKGPPPSHACGVRHLPRLAGEEINSL